jgi:hypothetical protein
MICDIVNISLGDANVYGIGGAPVSSIDRPRVLVSSSQHIHHYRALCDKATL